MQDEFARDRFVVVGRVGTVEGNQLCVCRGRLERRRHCLRATHKTVRVPVKDLLKQKTTIAVAALPPASLPLPVVASVLAVAEPSAPHAWHALAQPWRVAIMARPADAWISMGHTTGWPVCKRTCPPALRMPIGFYGRVGKL